MKNVKIFILLAFLIATIYACQKDSETRLNTLNNASVENEVQLRDGKGDEPPLTCCEVAFLGVDTLPWDTLWGNYQTQFQYKYPQATAKQTRRTTFTITRLQDGQSWTTSSFIPAGVPYCSFQNLNLEPAFFIAQHLGNCHGYYTVTLKVEVKQAGEVWSVCSSATSVPLLFGSVNC